MYVCLDCFLETIQKVPLKEKMPDYKGIFQEQSAVPFIINKFMSKLEKPIDSQRLRGTYVINATGLFVLAFHREIVAFLSLQTTFFVSVEFPLSFCAKCVHISAEN